MSNIDHKRGRQIAADWAEQSTVAEGPTGDLAYLARCYEDLMTEQGLNEKVMGTMETDLARARENLAETAPRALDAEAAEDDARVALAEASHFVNALEYYAAGGDDIRVARDALRSDEPQEQAESQRTIEQRRMDELAEQRSFKMHDKPDINNREWLELAYVTEGRSTGEIAAVCRCFVSDVRRAMARFGIDVRTRAEDRKSRRARIAARSC